MTNYNKFATPNPKVKEVEVEPVTETSNEEVIQEEVKVIEPAKVQSGTVVDCNNLYIRKDPTKTASNVIDILVATDVVEVFLDESTDDWYKIKSKDHVEGFCMKQYITLM